MEHNELNVKYKRNSKIISTVIFILAILMLHSTAFSMGSRGGLIPVGTVSHAPGFTLPDLEGRMISLEDFKGKVVIVSIWATWCAPCRAEAPYLEKLYQTFKGDDFILLAISIDEDGKRSIVPFMERKKLSFPVLLDPEKNIMELFGAEMIPESFIIKKDGTIASKVEGAYDWSSKEMIKYIHDLINEN